MRTNNIQMIILLLATSLITSNSMADTFVHQETGDTFTGFVTQKTTGSRTLVYNSDKSGLMSVNLNEYTVTPNSQGRKDNVVVIPITQSEVLLSEVVSKKVAQTIINASNKGPQAIIIQIDNPGGRGDYMKIITTAITQTTNCPILAYISGESYGGAFSAAALIAMACDAIYISPTASIGAIGPYTGTTVSDEEFSDYINTYCSESLASYGPFATALAHEHERPPLLVRALIDKRLSVIEVENTGTGGGRSFIQPDERQPTQTRIRTLAEGISRPEALQTIPQGQVISAVLNLPPTLAVEVGLVDKITVSLNGVLTEMKLNDFRLTNASGIENTVKKYAAARRNIAAALSRIQWLEDRSALLENQLTEIEQQLRTGIVTREVTRARVDQTPYRRKSGFPIDYNGYYYDPGLGGGRFVFQDNRYLRSGNSNRQNRGVETIVTQQPSTSILQVRQELVVVLNELIAEYRRVMNQAKRWPGGLPPLIPYQTLQQNEDTARALRDYLLNPSFLGQYGLQQQTTIPQTTRRSGY